MPLCSCACAFVATHSFQVDGQVGYYDRTGPDSVLKGEFSLTADCEVQPSLKRAHAFSVRGSGLKHKNSVFTFAAVDEPYKDAWIAAFEAHIEFVRAREELDMDRVEYAFG